VAEEHRWMVVSTDVQVVETMSGNSMVSKQESGKSPVYEPSSPVAEGDEVSHTLSRRHNAMRSKKRSQHKLLLTSASTSSVETIGGLDQVEVQYPGNRLLSPIEDTTFQLEKWNLSAAASSSDVCQTELSTEQCSVKQYEEACSIQTVNVCSPVQADVLISNDAYNPFTEPNSHEEDETSVVAENMKIDVNETDVYSLFRTKDVSTVNMEPKHVRPSTEGIYCYEFHQCL